LRNAWTHSEALQTTELSGLINYICDVIETVRDYPTQMNLIFHAEDVSQYQEVLVFSYLVMILGNLERIAAEHTVMGILRSRRAFMNGIRVLEKYHTFLSTVIVLKISEALSLIADTEDFSSIFEEYVSGRDDADLMVSLKTKCLSSFSSDFEARRLIRPLSDAIDKANRKYNKK
jgi:hypothetical protein